MAIGERQERVGVGRYAEESGFQSSTSTGTEGPVVAEWRRSYLSFGRGAPDEDKRDRVSDVRASLQAVRSVMDAERAPGKARGRNAQVVRSRLLSFEASIPRTPGAGRAPVLARPALSVCLTGPGPYEYAPRS